MFLINRSFRNLVEINKEDKKLDIRPAEKKYKTKNEFSPETAIDDQQYWYNNSQQSRAICKCVDPKTEARLFKHV